jgi:hypothetical protein
MKKRTPSLPKVPHIMFIKNDPIVMFMMVVILGFLFYYLLILQDTKFELDIVKVVVFF